MIWYLHFQACIMEQYFALILLQASVRPRVACSGGLIDNNNPENLVQMLFKVTRVCGSTDSISSLRVSQRLLAHHVGGSDMCFFRLSMPIQCAAILSSPVGGVLPVASNSLSPGSDDTTSYHFIHSTYVSNIELKMTNKVPQWGLKKWLSCHKMNIEWNNKYVRSLQLPTIQITYILPLRPCWFVLLKLSRALL